MTDHKHHKATEPAPLHETGQDFYRTVAEILRTARTRACRAVVASLRLAALGTTLRGHRLPVGESL